MSKNIVICCDGTNNKFGKTNTNVVKLYSLLPNNFSSQVTYYDPGVGTFSSLPLITKIGKWISRQLGNAFGLGITANVKQAYEYLMSSYEQGDKIYLFGFSRGAYTVRILAGLIHKCGILTKNNRQLIPYAYKLFEEAENYKTAVNFKKSFSVYAKIHFLGIWDTVSSVGRVYDPKSWPYTTRNRSINAIRHAVAIDERRAFFRQNLVKKARNNQNIKEVWFPGVHSDVGGGYEEGNNGLSKIALEWMLKEAKNFGLILKSQSAINRVINYELPLSNPEFKVNKSLRWYWRWAEFYPKYSYNFKSKKRKLRLNRGRKRYIAENSIIKKEVFALIKATNKKYNPSNLPDKYTIEP